MGLKYFLVAGILFLCLNHSASSVYLVEKNDTLWSISKKFGVSIDVIIKINDLYQNKLPEGRKLFIPDFILDYTISNGDSLLSIAKANHSKMEAIVLYNNLQDDRVFIGKKIKIPVIQAKEVSNKNNLVTFTNQKIILYEVKKGDTLTSICKQFQVNISDVLLWNKKKNSVLLAGEKIKILGKRNETYQITSPQNNTNKTHQGPIMKDKLSSAVNELPLLCNNYYLFPFEKKLIQSFQLTSRGINFTLKKSCKVWSLNNGVVEWVGSMRGYNKVVIVGYGNDKKVVYGYLTDVYVKKGDFIKNKEVIGQTGYREYLKKTSLYLEMRKGNDFVSILELFPFLKNTQYLVKNN